MNVAQIEALEQLKARCSPDPQLGQNCKRCYGKRGWHGVSIGVDGTPALMYCCGIDGKSEFSLVEAQVKEVAKALANFSDGYYVDVQRSIEALKVFVAEEIAATRGQQTVYLNQLIERLTRMGTANSVGHTDAIIRLAEIRDYLEMPWWKKLFGMKERAHDPKPDIVDVSPYRPTPATDFFRKHGEEKPMTLEIDKNHTAFNPLEHEQVK